MKKVLITGSDGFIGKNLYIRLQEEGYGSIVRFGRKNSLADLDDALAKVDFIFHLAGVNRPSILDEFKLVNTGLTEYISHKLLEIGRRVPIVFSSSIQAEKDNLYGRSKLEAEINLQNYRDLSGADVFIYRLPNVFGKWCKPNYNSVVATFCANAVMDKKLEINDPNASLKLVYVDDVCNSFLKNISGKSDSSTIDSDYIYELTVGELATIISRFKEERKNLSINNVGVGLIRALYATFLSYYEPEQFSYSIPVYADHRGVFAEMLKTKACGQFSYFTVFPGATRGKHYHHTKNEKFLVLKGKALFKFKNIITNMIYEIAICESEAKIVETVPGWSHSITNIGNDELIVMLWANEIFDKSNPDTISYEV